MVRHLETLAPVHRVSVDPESRRELRAAEETFEAMLDAAFYVVVDERRYSRDEFMTMILRKDSDRKLTRFDVNVLTVRKAEDGWTAVITEKIEVERTAEDGTVEKAYSLWVTRDGFRQDGDQWIVTYSEAIGYENWFAGTKPPFEDW